MNKRLKRLPFRMLTVRSFGLSIRPGDFMTTIDLMDAYFHLAIAERHRRFLRFAFEGVAYKYITLPFGLSLAPRCFTKCVDAALRPLRERGVRILNCLDDWMLLGHSPQLLSSHIALVLDHLHSLGFQVNFLKCSLTPAQEVEYLGLVLDSRRVRATLSRRRQDDIRSCLVSFRLGFLVTVRQCLRLLGLLCAASNATPLGLLHLRPALLGEMGRDLTDRPDPVCLSLQCHLDGPCPLEAPSCALLRFSPQRGRASESPVH